MPYELVPLPPGVPPGAVVGRRGRNIKWLMTQSGARITVDNSGVHVKARTHEALILGVEVVSRQLHANVHSVVDSSRSCICSRWLPCSETAALEKIETSTTKCHFVSLLSGQQLDMRVKLLGLYGNAQDPVAREVAEVVVATCRRVGLTAFMDCPSRHLPPNRHLYADVVRKRTRTMYVGAIQAPDGSSHRLEFVAQTTSEAGEHARNHRGAAGYDEHWEMGGALPDVDVELQRMLATEVAGAGLEGPRAAEAPGVEPAGEVEEVARNGKKVEEVEEVGPAPSERLGAASCGGMGAGGGFSPCRAEAVLGALAAFVGALNQHLAAESAAQPQLRAGDEGE
ncbi:hypothetical protein TSOC_008176 [Tetrabaena socialis]|uniref:K Homology domain-containing protein n=1 Tax=Tetrabaena socialis TaxID=47790 RepID=A0A2J7ZZ52_9CHLO|nr:hypothetical protein TSOC_008176 [Tetrabaena socialis]|eukprot:PNH05547.1 hypothetical protein TSOC_008176 [Tetrabaena socialis]